jgi:Domain of unknown function (DUF4185)
VPRAHLAVDTRSGWKSEARAGRYTRLAVRWLRAVVSVSHLLVLAGCVAGVDRVSYPRSASGVHSIAGSTRKICQLTGEMDNSLAKPAAVLSHTEQRAHLSGTDLGVSFSGPTSGAIHFLFGDTVPLTRGLHADSDDAVAVMRADADPERCLDLAFYTDPGGEYEPLELAGFDLGSFDVPTSAFVFGGATFGTFATNATGTPRRPTRSVLAVAEHFPQQLVFTYIADLSPSKMTNVSSVLVDDYWRPSSHPTRVLYFGTGVYRSAQNVFLEAFPLADIRAGTHMWYAGRSGASAVKWRVAEEDARPIFDRDGPPCMGELSVTWNRYLGRWLMLYNCDRPGGILFRVAREPWGPWSEPGTLFDPRADHGYCIFIHEEHPEKHCAQGGRNPSDNLVWRDHGSRSYGGEYGPYVIDGLTRGDATHRTTRIYFTLSTWNPYQVVLMTTTLTR